MELKYCFKKLKKTATQKTLNDGYHYIFWLNKIEFRQISEHKHGLIINGIKYTIDIRATNGLIYVQPFQGYKWLLKPELKNIYHLPESIFNVIKN